MNDLIIVIVPKYRDEEVMEEAKKIGAKGGTILHGRSIQSSDCYKLLGIVVEPEKEVVLILVDNKLTDQILEALDNKLELGKNNNSLALVVDVNYVVGLRK